MTGQVALGQPLHQQRIENFEARHAGRILQHVRIGLAVLRPAHMVGGDHRDIAGGEMLPTSASTSLRGRIGGLISALPPSRFTIVLFIENEIMNAGFDGGVEALPAIGLAQVIAAAERSNGRCARSSQPARRSRRLRPWPAFR